MAILFGEAGETWVVEEAGNLVGRSLLAREAEVGHPYIVVDQRHDPGPSAMVVSACIPRLTIIPGRCQDDWGSHISIAFFSLSGGFSAFFLHFAIPFLALAFFFFSAHLAVPCTVTVSVSVSLALALVPVSMRRSMRLARPIPIPITVPFLALTSSTRPALFSLFLRFIVAMMSSSALSAFFIVVFVFMSSTMPVLPVAVAIAIVLAFTEVPSSRPRSIIVFIISRSLPTFTTRYVS